MLWCTVNQSSINLEIKQGYTMMHGQPIINKARDQTSLYYDARSTNHQSIWRSNKVILWCTVNQSPIKLEIKQGYIMMHGQPIINQVGDQTRAYYDARSTIHQSSWRSNKVILWCTVNQPSINLEIKQGYTIMHGQPIINDVGDQTRLYYDARSTNHQWRWRSNKVILWCAVNQSSIKLEIKQVYTTMHGQPITKTIYVVNISKFCC